MALEASNNAEAWEINWDIMKISWKYVWHYPGNYSLTIDISLGFRSHFLRFLSNWRGWSVHMFNCRSVQKVQKVGLDWKNRGCFHPLIFFIIIFYPNLKVWHSLTWPFFWGGTTVISNFQTHSKISCTADYVVQYPSSILIWKIHTSIPFISIIHHISLYANPYKPIPYERCIYIYIYIYSIYYIYFIIYDTFLEVQFQFYVDLVDLVDLAPFSGMISQLLGAGQLADRCLIHGGFRFVIGLQMIILHCRLGFSLTKTHHFGVFPWFFLWVFLWFGVPLLNV